MTDTTLTNNGDEPDSAKKVSISDIQQKIRDTIGKNPIKAEASSKQLLLLKAASAFVVVILAYVVGRSQGKRTSTILEVKRV